MTTITDHDIERITRRLLELDRFERPSNIRQQIALGWWELWYWNQMTPAHLPVPALLRWDTLHRWGNVSMLFFTLMGATATFGGDMSLAMVFMHRQRFAQVQKMFDGLTLAGYEGDLLGYAYMVTVHN